MAGDPKGYYAELGLSASASNEETKAVYRALLKIYHPDVNKDRAAAEKARRINDAYDVLGDPKKRSAYDATFGGSTPPPRPSGPPPRPQSAPQSQQPDPIHCSVCNRVTAQPRFVVFRKVTSVVVVTRTTPKGGIYCADCAAKVALGASALTAALGWWGVPWGPILSIKEIVRNAFGGERKPEIDEQLLWNNAVAFLDRKNDLAMSLAAQLQTAKDANIAAAAKNLVGVLAANGVPVAKLKSPWRFRPGNAIGQMLLGAIVPVIGVVWYSSANAGYHSATYYPQSYTAPASSTFDTSYGSSAPAVVNHCFARPANGAVLSPGFLPSAYGHKLTIQNGSAGDAIVKLRSAYGRGLVASFFVGRGMTASLDGISDGDYRVQFASGDAMNSDCASFVDPSASEFNGIQHFQSSTEGDQIVTQELSFTLYGVPGGNVTPNLITAAAFDAD